MIIMYLSLKKTFSLHRGLPVKADLLCIRKLARGVLATFGPPVRLSSLSEGTFLQSSFLVRKSQGFPYGVQDASRAFS